MTFQNEWSRTIGPLRRRHFRYVSSVSPRALAETDKPLALAWVRAAITAMEAPGDPLTAAALAANFGWSQLGWAKRFLYRGRIEESLASIDEVLEASGRFFADVSDEDATALFGAALPPAYASHHGRISFTSRFAPWDPATQAGFGPCCRTAMLVHEAVHVFDPRSGEPDIHVSEWDPRFDTMAPDLLLHNPSAYASFAAQIYTRSMKWPRTVRFGAGNPGT